MEAKAKKRKSQPLPFLLAAYPLMLLMSASIVWPYIKALDLGVGIPAVLVMNAAFLALFTVSFRSLKTTLALLAAMAGAAGIAALLYYSGQRSMSDFTREVDLFLYWARDYLSGFHLRDASYSAALTAIYSFIVCFIVALFTVRKLEALVVSLCGAACYVSLVIIGHTVDIPSMFACILAAMLYFLLQNYKTSARDMPGARIRGLPAYMLSVLPFAAVALALTVVFSAMLPIDPDWMKETRDKLVKKVEPGKGAFAEMTENLVISRTELGGPLLLNDDELMEVRSPVGNMYLKGMSRDIYTGHSWEQVQTAGRNLQQAKEFDETYDSMKLYTQNDEELYKLLPSAELTVHYTGLTTRLIYTPPKTMKLSFKDGKTTYGFMGSDTLYMQGGKPEGAQYTAGYLYMDRTNGKLLEILNGCRRGFYGEIFDKYQSGESELPDGRKSDYNVIMSELTDSKIIADEIYSQYLQLPDSVPQRVRDLASEITAGAASDYERARAIGQYLSANYTYTLTPGPYDSSKDFVDEFLFEGKQGYCTYYATAMTVLLRCAGIPARYVEGYVTPPASGGVSKVTKRQGHAWTEVYFEGFGWYPMEPTTSFSMDSTGTVSPVTSPSPSPSQGTKPPATTPPAASESSKPAATSGKPTELAPLLLILAVFSALCALVCVPLASRSRLLRTKPKYAALVLYAQYLKLLKLQSLEQTNGEPLADFAARVDALPSLTQGGFMAAAQVFQLARFSPHDITYEQKQLMLDYRRKLARACGRGAGWLKLLFSRYVWGM